MNAWRKTQSKACCRKQVNALSSFLRQHFNKIVWLIRRSCCCSGRKSGRRHRSSQAIDHRHRRSCMYHSLGENYFQRISFVESSTVSFQDLLNLAPRKPDWDLKRDVSKKLDKLERRTQRAIIEIISTKKCLLTIPFCIFLHTKHYDFSGERIKLGEEDISIGVSKASAKDVDSDWTSHFIIL